MSHKRVVSENSKDLSDPTRHKTARPSSQMSPAVSEATVEQLNAEVARLNAYIDEVHGFIDSLHATARAPPQIQNRMNQRAGAAAKLAESIRANMDLVHERMENDLLDYRHSGVTADDVSKAMVPYIDQIAKLSRLQDPGALRLAQEVLLELASNTTPVEDASGYGERPSDAKCDDLLYSILERRADAIDMEHDVVKKTKEEIEDTAKSLAGYGIEPWFPKSLELLKEFEYSY